MKQNCSPMHCWTRSRYSLQFSGMHQNTNICRWSRNLFQQWKQKFLTGIYVKYFVPKLFKLIVKILTIFHSYYLCLVIGNINCVRAICVLTKQGGKFKNIKRAGHVESTRYVLYQYTILVEKRSGEQTTPENCAFLGRTVLKLILKKQVVQMCVRFIWLRM
jgi:hypothetical protein